MSNGKRNHPLLVMSIAVLSWLVYSIALIVFPAIFLRWDHKIESDWWIFCIGMAFVVISSTIGIAAARKCTHGQMVAYLAGGAIGSIVIFAWFGALAGSLSEQGFVWVYLLIGIVPGALQGLATYAAIRLGGAS